jgi:MFS superfamily sulfate permease-like transporter
VILPSLRGFRFAWLPSDLLAGAVLAAIAIPEQLATAQLASMPAQTGLYAFAAGSLAFAIFGSNRYLSVGADSTIAPIFAVTIAALAAASSASYAVLVGFATLLTGLALVLAGALRLGWLADLLSIPVTTGFLAGIAVHIIVGQLPVVLGVPGGSGSLLLHLVALVRNLPHVNAMTLAIGAGVFGLTLATERISPRLPGALLGLIGAGVAAAALHLGERGVAFLSAPSSALPRVRIAFVSVHDALSLVPVALIVALVCLIQTALVLRSFPSNPDAPEEPSHDFAAVGIGSIASAMLGSFAVNASPPRTAIVASSGGRSQVSSIVAAALGGVLIFIGTRIFRYADMVRIARLGGGEIWLVAAGAFLVIVLPIQTGMLLGIVLSLVHGIYVVARPPSTELVHVPGTTIWWPPDDNTPGERVRGVLVFAPAAPITFTNGHYIVERLAALAACAPQPVRLVVLECSGVMDIDYTGARLVCAAIAGLRARGITVAIARMAVERARNAARRTGLLAALGPQRVFKSVQEAIDAFDPHIDRRANDD